MPSNQLKINERRKAIQRNEPIELYGLTFYPITMNYFEEWTLCKSALLLRQSTLPAFYAAKPFLAALCGMDMEVAKSTGRAAGFMESITTILCLSLRIPIQFKAQLIKPIFDEKDQLTLAGFIIRQDNMQAKITSAQFNKVRELIAEQNGEELPNEADNPELVKSKSEYDSIGKSQLKPSLDNIIDSVSYNSRIPKTEIYEWTIRDFEIRRATIRRDKGYAIFTLAEFIPYVKFQHGNPYPSYEFDRDSDSGFMRPEGEILRKHGQTAEIKN